MKIVIIHNRYQTRGGEEKQVDEQIRLLEAKGHTVRVYSEDSQNFQKESPVRKLLAMAQMPFSLTHYGRLRKMLRSFKPDAVHIHNVFPLLSPSVYYACSAERIPVVQSVHNYRFMCSNGLFLLPDGKICERCRTGSHWNAVAFKCYGGKRSRSISMALTLAMHQALGTFRDRIQAYVMTSQFLKSKLVESGFPADRMHLLPPLFEPVAKRTLEQEERTLLFIGRLSKEKGVSTLLQAAQRLPQWTLKIVGQGPMEDNLHREVALRRVSNVQFLGSVSYDALQILLQEATFLVVPSECYENFPTVFLEAWAFGLPVIASRLGGMAEAVQEKLNGFLFTPGDASALASLIRTLGVEKSRSMREGILEQFQKTYASDLHYQKLMQTYQTVLDQTPSN